MSNYHSHQQLKFFGYTESFLFENVEDKLKIINEAFTLLESLTKSQILTKIQHMINFHEVWNKAYCQKIFFSHSSWYINFDNWWLSDDPYYLSFKKRNKFSSGHDFFEKIGFWDKWIPEDVNQLKDLFDKKAEEFILPNTKHYPEILDLEYSYDYSYSDE